MADDSLLDITLRAARRDRQSVTSSGEPIRRLADGVRTRALPTHTDARGSLTELFDPRWGWHPGPVVTAYCITLRPGFVKGWNLHREHEDRYALVHGEMEIVFFDPRPESPTCGEVSTIVVSEQARCLVHIPRNVWHADHNIGATDVLLVNFPTVAYNHENPDKYRLPLDTDLIPYRFDGAKGW
jgi:dTDP-4-dehydrorhamnose 3,5-epimerase